MGWRYLIFCFALLLSVSSARAQQNPLSDLGDLLGRILNPPAPQAPRSDPSQPQDSGDMGFTIRALNAALESGRTGTLTEWHNPGSGFSGAVTPLSDHKYSGGRTCRMFRRIRGAGGVTEIHDGSASIPDKVLNHTPLTITGQRYARPSLDALRPAMQVACGELEQRTGSARS